ncbi:MAG: hypothetical protein RSC93_14410, partial [Erysipelotrichaceae bacterium]
MKKINKMILCLTIIFAMALSNLPIVNAGGMGISASTTSVKVGNTFSVTVVANGVVAQNLSVSGSGCTILNGIGNSLVLGESATINVRLDSASGCSVTIAGKYVDYSAAEEVFTPFSQTVSISAYVAPSVAPSRPSSAPNGEPKADPRSKDNNLSSLSIDQGKLTPDFNA